MRPRGKRGACPGCRRARAGSEARGCPQKRHETQTPLDL